jgi:hypothetical protein
MVANRCRRIDDHYRQPLPRKLQRHLLGQILRPLIVPRHLRQRNRRRLITQPIRYKPNAPDRAGIDNALNTGLLSRLQQMARSRHVRLVQLRRVRRPKPVISGHMVNNAASVNSAFQRCRIGQIARNHLNIQFRHRIAPPCHRPHRNPGRSHQTRHMPPQKTGCSRY